MNTLDAAASEVAYLQHIWPIWQALPDANKGILHLTGAALEYAAKHGIGGLAWPTWAGYERALADKGPKLLVAGGADIAPVRWRDVARMEHGVGGLAGGKGERHPYTAAGAGNERMMLALMPNEQIAERVLDNWPKARVAIVGMPKLDWWHRLFDGPQRPPRNPLPLVVLSSHWDMRVSREQESALRYYTNELIALSRDSRWRLAIHGHPRAEEMAKVMAESLGVPYLDYDTVMLSSDLLINDSSSLIFEFASLAKPVLRLNTPFYGKKPESLTPVYAAMARLPHQGHVGDDLTALVAGILALGRTEAIRGQEGPTDEIIPYRDGNCTARAVRELLRFIEAP